MTDRDRFVSYLLGEPVDRPPFWLFWGPWGRTWQRWIDEGKPEEITDHRSHWQPDAVPHVVPVNCGPCPRVPHQVLESGPDDYVHVDHWGIVRRDTRKGESMPQFLRFPIASRRDWEEYRDLRLDPDQPDRLAGNWAEVAGIWQAAGIPIQLGYFPDVGIFGGVRWLLGDEECLLTFCTDPALIHEIMERLTDVYLTVFAAVVKLVRVDVIEIWEDMCGRQGPLISPAMWREFMGPCYRRIRAFADEHGIPLLEVDTDGDPRLIVDPMREAGVNFLWPLEVAAGCDVNEFRRRWPDLGVMGGIDKRALAVGPAAIDAELDRVWPAVEAGRYIPDLDHLVPSDVSWSNYAYYADALKRRVVG